MSYNSKFLTNFLLPLFSAILPLSIFFGTNLIKFLYIFLIIVFIFIKNQDKKIFIQKTLTFNYNNISVELLKAFILINALSIIINHEGLEYILKSSFYLAYFLSFFLLAEILPTWSKEKTNLLVFDFFTCFSIVASLALAYYQVYVLGFYRALGGTHIMNFGYTMGLMFVLILGTILHTKLSKNKLNILIAILICCLACIVLSGTRGSMLGVIVGTFLSFFYTKFRKASALFILTSLALYSSLILSSWGYTGSKVSFAQRLMLKPMNESDIIRIDLLKSGLLMIKEKPLLGHGHQGYAKNLLRIKEENGIPLAYGNDPINQLPKEERYFNNTHSHNIFLETFVSSGLLGFSAFCGWIILWIKELLIGPVAIKKVILPFIICFVIQSQFEFTLSPHYATIIIFIFALSVNKNENNQHAL